LRNSFGEGNPKSKWKEKKDAGAESLVNRGGTKGEDNREGQPFGFRLWSCRGKKVRDGKARPCNKDFRRARVAGPPRLVLAKT